MPADGKPKGKKPARNAWTVNDTDEIAAMFAELRAKWGGEAGPCTKNRGFELMVRKLHVVEFPKAKGGG